MVLVRKLLSRPVRWPVALLYSTYRQQLFRVGEVKTSLCPPKAMLSWHQPSMGGADMVDVHKRLPRRIHMRLVSLKPRAIAVELHSDLAWR